MTDEKTAGVLSAETITIADMDGPGNDTGRMHRAPLLKEIESLRAQLAEAERERDIAQAAHRTEREAHIATGLDRDRERERADEWARNAEALEQTAQRLNQETNAAIERADAAEAQTVTARTLAYEEIKSLKAQLAAAEAGATIIANDREAWKRAAAANEERADEWARNAEALEQTAQRLNKESTQPEPPAEPCGTCDGTRKIFLATGVEPRVCPDCHGTGREPGGSDDE